MKKSYVFISAAALLMLAACNKEASVQVPEADGQTIQLTLNATMGADETKTTMSYNDNYGSLQSVWAAGDKVYVYSKKTGNELGTLTIDSSSITNEGGGSTSYAATSKASFAGSVELGESDTIKDDFVFVYQGSGRSLSVADGLLSYTMNYSETVAGLSAWDVAYATGKIQGSAASASCAVSFANKMGFGYFTTEGITEDLTANYFESFTLDVKTGTIAGVSGSMSIPSDKAFYMPLIPGSVNIACERTWNDGKTAYKEVRQSITFNASANTYYRLGRNAETPFGPVPFEQDEDWVTFNTISSSKFDVAADKKVIFTPGNLQYIGSKSGSEYWRIAPTQYSYLGGSNAIPANTDAGVTYTGDVDLFGWGEVTPPFHGSQTNSDYRSDLGTNATLDVDWATKFNAETPTKLYVDKANNLEYSKPAGTGDYCVLTTNEWLYLLRNQYFAHVKVTVGNSTKNGLVVFPNTYTEESQCTALSGITKVRKLGASATNITGLTSAYEENQIDQSIIDNNSLLFLPAAGERSGRSINNVESLGFYWSSSSSSSAGQAYRMNFGATNIYGQNSYYRYYGRAVRLASVVQ